MFCKNLAWTTDEQSLGEFLEQYGEVTNVKILYGQDNRSRGMGFAEFGSKHDAENAIAKANGADVGGREINLSIATGKAGGGPRQGGNGGDMGAPEIKPEAEGSCTVFIGNVSFRASEDSIHAHFGEFGDNIADVRIAKDQEG